MNARAAAEAEIERRSRVMHEAARWARWGKPDNDEEPPPSYPLDGREDGG